MLSTLSTIIQAFFNIALSWELLITCAAVVSAMSAVVSKIMRDCQEVRLISRLVEAQTNRSINMFININLLGVSVLRSYQQVVYNY